MSYPVVGIIIIFTFLACQGFGVRLTKENLQQSGAAKTSDPVSTDETVFDDYQDNFDADDNDDEDLPYTGEILRIKHNEIRMRSLVRNAIKWNKHEIPYYFKTNLEHVMRPVFEDAVKYYEKHSCLRFRELHHWERSSRNYIEVVNGNHCALTSIDQSERGTSEKPQMILKWGCQHIKVLLHELGHAVGFHHSMWRYDRDDYLTVNEDNAVEEWQHNYEKGNEWENENYNLPYDLLSIMQYQDVRDIAIDDTIPIIEPKNPLYAKCMGLNFELTFIDLKMLNRFYDCTESCEIKTNCFNGGFQNSNKCFECVCPVGFGGYRCLHRAGSEHASTDCGATLMATTQWRPLDAHFNRTCTWWILAEKGKHVEIEFIHVDIDDSYWCNRTGLNVKLEDPLLTGFRICNPSMIPDVKEFKSEDNRAILNVYSNQKEVQHFLIMYRQVDEVPRVDQWWTQYCLIYGCSANQAKKFH